MNLTKKSILYCLISAIVFITICSKSSFIYPMNDWGDANCFFVLGKGMLSGLVPYRDFFEQKGIAIYALYAIGVLISGTSFMGIYFLEVLLFAAFLLVSLKIAALFIDVAQYSFVFTFFLAGIICSSALFCHGGSLEEMLFVLFAYGLYLGLKYFEKNVIPNKKEMFLFGLFAGIIFFSKFTLCIIYISVIIFIIVKAFFGKEMNILFRNVIWFLLGCIAITVPVIGYFLYNNALDDFLYVYFYKNIFDYTIQTPSSSVNANINQFCYNATFLFRKRNSFVILFMFLGQIWLIVRKKFFISLFNLVTFSMFYYLMYVAMSPRKYYGLPLTVFVLFGGCAVIDIINNLNLRISKIARIAFYAFVLVIAIVNTDNRYYMFKSKDTCPQYIFAKDMASYGYDDYHMLYYGTLDEGFYFASNTLPNCRAFCMLNLQGDELITIQNNHIDKKKCEFIVSDMILCDSDQYEEYSMKFNDKENDIVVFDDFGYEMIDEVDYHYEGYDFVMRLYKLID